MILLGAHPFRVPEATDYESGILDRWARLITDETIFFNDRLLHVKQLSVEVRSRLVPECGFSTQDKSQHKAMVKQVRHVDGTARVSVRTFRVSD
jgi:hypothetical protein